MIELAYELFVTVFEPMKIPADQKLKMASGIQKECVEQHNRQRHLKDLLRFRNYGKFKIKMEPLIISNPFLPPFRHRVIQPCPIKKPPIAPLLLQFDKAPSRPPPSAINKSGAVKSGAAKNVPVTLPVTKDVNKSVQVTCSKCKWLFSSRNETCPMCGAPIMLGEDDLIKIMVEYVDRQGISIEIKQSKEFLAAYKKQYKKLPSLDELWNAATQLAKLESMSGEQLKKMEEKKKEKGKLDLESQMVRLKDKKLKEKEQVESVNRQKLEEKKQVEEEIKRKEAETKAKIATTKIVCKVCGTENPGDSKFCLECGVKLQ